MDAKSSAVAQLEVEAHLLGENRAASTLKKKVTEAFLEFRDPVYRYLFHILNDPAEAEDLTQESFLRLFRELQSGKKIENMRAWIFRVAHNLAVDRHRQSNAELSERSAWKQTSEGSQSNPLEEALFKNEDYQKLQVALLQLSPQERRCLELRAEGLRYREIGEVLSIRISTVETFIARAIGKITRVLDV